MEIIKTSFDILKPLREKYFKSLPEFQELYIELMISDADCFLVKEENNTVSGYAIRTKERVLIEFYLIDNYIPHCLAYFDQIITNLSITNIYCKSFDSLLLSCCMLKSYSYTLLGVLYRDFFDKGILKNPDIIMTQANHASVEMILAQDDSIRELFETENQLRIFIDVEGVFLFSMSTNLVGCGTILKTNQYWNFCDLGVWVHPKFRKTGIGTQILINLRAYSLENGMKPTCGCAIDNIASQKTLEKSGFISKHKLIDFKVNK